MVAGRDAKSTLHGPWGKEMKSVQKKFTAPKGECSMSWRSWAIASRDGEIDRVYVA